MYLSLRGWKAVQFCMEANLCMCWSGIGFSWTRKALSGVRAHAEQVELPFFLYERNMASKFFAARVRAKQMGLTADVNFPSASFSCLTRGMLFSLERG